MISEETKTNNCPKIDFWLSSRYEKLTKLEILKWKDVFYQISLLRMLSEPLVSNSRFRLRSFHNITVSFQFHKHTSVFCLFFPLYSLKFIIHFTEDKKLVYSLLLILIFVLISIFILLFPSVIYLKQTLCRFFSSSFFCLVSFCCCCCFILFYLKIYIYWVLSLLK